MNDENIDTFTLTYFYSDKQENTNGTEAVPIRPLTIQSDTLLPKQRVTLLWDSKTKMERRRNQQLLNPEPYQHVVHLSASTAKPIHYSPRRDGSVTRKGIVRHTSLL